METRKQTSDLPMIYKALILTLRRCKVEEDALVGTILILKNMATQAEREDWLLWLVNNHPTPNQIDDHLVQFVNEKAAYREHIAKVRVNPQGNIDEVGYNRHATENQSAETGGVSQDEVQSGKPSSTSMNTPTPTSGDKVTETATNAQEKADQNSHLYQKIPKRKV